MKIDIIILNTAKAERVVRNAEFLLEQKTDFPFQIFVVDNSENPTQIALLTKAFFHHPQVRLFLCPNTFGYPHGNNWGVKQGNGEYIAIVNPDIFCHRNRYASEK